MAALSPAALKQLMVRTRRRYEEIERADWDTAGKRYRTGETTKWERAAGEVSPPEWAELVRILAQGWDYYGGSVLPGEGRR
jgi:hypothetical protein